MQTPRLLPANPIERLQLCARIVDQSAPALAEWLGGATMEHIYRGTSLDRALGLTGGSAGVRTPRLEYLLLLRNQHLRTALELCGGDFTALAAAVARFETRVWPRLSRGAEPDGQPLHQCLYESFRLNVGIPRTRKGLEKALAGRTESALLSSHAPCSNEAWIIIRARP